MAFHGFEHQNMVPDKAAPSTGAVLVVFKTEDGITEARGTTVPSDAATGYAPSCTFKGTTNGKEYINKGSKASCAFKESLTVDTAVASIAADQLSGTAAGAGPSPLIWDASLWAAVGLDPTQGYRYWRDYLDEIDITTTDGYTITTVNSGALSGSATEDGGVLFLDSAGNNAEDDGIQAQLTNCLFLPVAGRTIRFEARVKVNDNSALTGQFAIGLAGVDPTLIAAGVLDDVVSKCLWFHHGASTADKMSTCTSLDAEQDIDADKATTVDDTYIKLGFVINGITSIDWYADGVLVNTSDTANAIANNVMCLSFVSQTEGAAKDAEMSVDWVRILSEGARTA